MPLNWRQNLWLILWGIIPFSIYCNLPIRYAINAFLRVLWRKWADKFGSSFSHLVYLNLWVSIQSVGFTCYVYDKRKTENTPNYVTLGIKDSPKFFFLVSWNFAGHIFLLHHINFFHKKSARLSYVLWNNHQSYIFMYSSICTNVLHMRTVGLCQVRQQASIMQNTLIYFVNIWTSGEFICDSLRSGTGSCKWGF